MLIRRKLYLVSFYLVVLESQATSPSFKDESLSVMKPGEGIPSNLDRLRNKKFQVGVSPITNHGQSIQKGKLPPDDIEGTLNDPDRTKRLRRKRTLSSGRYGDDLYSMENKQFGSSGPYSGTSYPKRSYMGSSFPQSSYSNPYYSTKSSPQNSYGSSRSRKSKAGHNSKYSWKSYGKSKPEAKQYGAQTGRGGYGYGAAQRSGYPVIAGYPSTNQGTYATGTNAGSYAPAYAAAPNGYGASSGNYYPSVPAAAVAPQQSYYQPSTGGAVPSASPRYYPASSSGKTAPAYYPTQGGVAATQHNHYAPSSAGAPSSGYYPSPSKSYYPLDPATAEYAGKVGGGYPTQSAGYPSQSAGYPSQSAGYPSQSAGYPSQSAGYPTQSAGYPSQSAGYPAPAGYPASSGSGGYPPPGGGYPASAPAAGYPARSAAYPAPGGYPAQSPPYTTGPAADPYPDAFDEKALAKAIGKVLKKASAERKEKRERRKSRRRRKSSEGKSSHSRELKGQPKTSRGRRSRDQPRPPANRERSSRRRSRRRRSDEPRGRNFESSKEIPIDFSAEELPEVTSTSTEQDGSKSKEYGNSAEQRGRSREEDVYNKDTRRRTDYNAEDSADGGGYKRDADISVHRTPYNKMSATFDGKANSMISGILGSLFKTAMSNHEAEAKRKAVSRYIEPPPATKIASNLDKLNTMIEAMSSKLNKMSNSGNSSKRKSNEGFERSPS